MRDDFMDKKYILIIVVVIAIVAGAAYLLFNGSVGTTTTTEAITDHSTMVLSKSAYMEVPKSDNKTDDVNKKGVHHYNDNTYGINITSCSNLSSSSSVKEMKDLKNSITVGAKKLKENDIVIYEKNGTYSIFVKNTQYNDTLLIQSSDKNLLLQCWESVNYHDPAQKIQFNDTGSDSSSVINVVQKTENAVQSSSSSSSSSTSSSSSSGSGSGGYSDFGFSSSRSSSGSVSSGSSGGGMKDFGFD